MLVGLADGVHLRRRDPDVRCAILTGAGGHFCSGVDLEGDGHAVGRASTCATRMAEEPNLHWKALLRDYRLSKPLIAAVEGYAVAGGTEMLQGTDIRVAGERRDLRRVGGQARPVPARRLGVRLPRQIPYTMRWTSCSRRRPVTAHEAKQIGLIGRSCPTATR